MYSTCTAHLKLTKKQPMIPRIDIKITNKYMYTGMQYWKIKKNKAYCTSATFNTN